MGGGVCCGYTLPIIASDPEGVGVGLLYLSYQVILRGGSGFTLPFISSDPEGVGGGSGYTLPIISSDPEGRGVSLFYLSYQVILRRGGWVYFTYHIK